jgi:hypothetical protein
MYGVGGLEVNDAGFKHAATPPLLQFAELQRLFDPLNVGCVVACALVLTLTTVASANGRILSAVLAARDCTKAFARSSAVMKCSSPFPWTRPLIADLGVLELQQL